MRLTTFQAALGSASLFFAASPVSATHAHRQAHEEYGKRHSHNDHHQSGELLRSEARNVQKRAPCSLPDHPDLIHVPGDVNNGFAMSPDEPCEDGKYCPFACAPGKVMAQWEPNSTYVYPQSMNGGLYCNGGKPEKPFPNAPYCVDGTGTVKVVNKCGKVVSFCQTVLPGNEAMIIPTDISSTATIAVPGISYWDSTAAHYYINAPGVPSSKGCVWGKPDEPIGNWSPYVAGANTDANGMTFLKIAWNPIYTGCELSKKKPNFGVKIECPGGGCNGLPCSINPATDGVGGLVSPVSTVGVGGASFCVVTVPKGGTANIVVFNTDGSEGSAESAPPSSSSKTPTPTPTPTPSTSSTSSTPKPTTSSTSSTSSSSSSTTLINSSVVSSSSTLSSSSESSSSTSSTSSLRIGGIFHEKNNNTATTYAEVIPSTTGPAVLAFATQEAAPVSTTSKNEGPADQGGAAIAGLVVALVAAAALY
ncbi:hypothetical protein B0T17DRAFT_92654 [Bombardia bombarda]|uniref:Uncharacterized protein n=1 Tax=Bombardia bombarda TaxID=252184 RepID=A0AA39XMQ1_9PEZI|nr:hypothetical protein B0T17DRAFT_92654 [Bombardia bombarda]